MPVLSDILRTSGKIAEAILDKAIDFKEKACPKKERGASGEDSKEALKQRVLELEKELDALKKKLEK